jgi:MFS family permease
MLTTLRQRNFFLLWFAGLISFTGNWMLSIAIPVTVYERTQSTFAVSLVMMSIAIPRVLFGSVAGVFVDRWERKRTMVIANLLLLLSILPLLAFQTAQQLWLVMLVAFVQSAIGQFFAPAENAMLPNLVHKEQLVSANALNALNNNLARLIGPVLGGIIISVAGLCGVVVVDALTYLVAAVLILLISVTSQPVQDTERNASFIQAFKTVFQQWREGLQVIRQHIVVRTMFICNALMGIGEGVVGVLFVPFVTDVLHGEAIQLGWLMSAQAVGGILGSFVIGWIGSRMLPLRLFAVSAILFGIIDLLIFNYSAFASGIGIGLVLFVLVGIPVIGTFTSFNTLLQTHVEDSYRGRVFGTFGTTFAIFSVVGMQIAGSMADSVGIVPIINIQAIAPIAAGLLAWFGLRQYFAKTLLTTQPVADKA